MVYLVLSVIEAVGAVASLAIHSVGITLAVELDAPTLLAVAPSFAGLGSREVRGVEISLILFRG